MTADATNIVDVHFGVELSIRSILQGAPGRHSGLRPRTGTERARVRCAAQVARRATDMCVKRSGARFPRLRDFKQY